MKFSTVTIFSLAAVSHAETDSSTVEGPEERRYNSIMEMAFTQVTTTYTRKDFENRISKYGCHCFPQDTKAAGGPGRPVDSLDTECWSLSKCHKCVMITYGDSTIKTNLKDLDRFDHYKWQLMNDNSISCDNEKSDAKKALCQCDKQFAERMGAVWQDTLPNDFYWLSNKNVKNNAVFDYGTSCVATGFGITADACCGSGFPTMEPYNSANKDCCSATASIFNPATHMCCNNGGGVQSIGSC